MLHISSIDQWNDLLEKNNSFFFLKHSSTCSLSEIAWEEYTNFAKNNQDVVTAYLIVQEDRELSNYIAETFSITHHSPQVFKLVDGQPVFHTSHRSVTEENLVDQL